MKEQKKCLMALEIVEGGDIRAFPLDSERSGENQFAQVGCRSCGAAGLGCLPSIGRSIN